MSSDDQASVRFLLGPTTPCWVSISLPVSHYLFCKPLSTGGKVCAYRSFYSFKSVFWAQKRILG